MPWPIKTNEIGRSATPKAKEAKSFECLYYVLVIGDAYQHFYLIVQVIGDSGTRRVMPHQIPY
jgi:hypothetical protein